MGAQQSGRGITAVVFDVNGVLEDSVYSAIAEAATATGTDPTGLLEVFGGTHGADGNHPWHRAERGEIGLIRCVIGLAREARKYEFNVPVTALVHAITNLGVHQRSLDLVDELRSDGIAVGVITNGVKNFSKRWRHKTGAEERFDVILESWREGIRKPNPEIFHRLLQQLDRDPSEVLFVDDLEANVKAAEALGMHGLVFGRPSESCPEIRQRIANSRTINIGATIEIDPPSQATVGITYPQSIVSDEGLSL